MLAPVLSSTLAAVRQVLSPGLRRLLWRTLGFTFLCLALLWWGLTRALDALLRWYPMSAEYPRVDAVLVFVAGAGLLVGFLYVLPVVSALVAGFFLDDAAAVVEATDFPGQAPGRPMSLGRSVLVGLRFSGLALAVNAGALLLLLVPGVNLVVFFAANAYLLSREYFEMAAARFRAPAEAARLRRENRATVLAAGCVMATLMLVPVLNLVTPLFGIALMVHLQKRIAASLPPPL